jgi:hypothetical protein
LLFDRYVAIFWNAAPLAVKSLQLCANALIKFFDICNQMSEHFGLIILPDRFTMNMQNCKDHFFLALYKHSTSTLN